MGTTLLVTAGPIRVSSNRKGKPRKILAGEIRTIVRKCLAKLNSIMNHDARAFNRALAQGYESFSIMGDDNSLNGRAFTRVMARLKECLDAKEGDV